MLKQTDEDEGADYPGYPPGGEPEGGEQEAVDGQSGAHLAGNLSGQQGPVGGRHTLVYITYPLFNILNSEFFHQAHFTNQLDTLERRADK